MKKLVIKSTITMLSLGLLFFIMLFVIPIVYNNILHGRFLSSIKKMELPLTTRRISAYNLFGIIWGAGNHCDHSVGLLIESELDYAEIGSFFADADIFKNIKYPYAKTGADIVYLTQDGIYYIDNSDVNNMALRKLVDGVTYGFYLEKSEKEAIRRLYDKADKGSGKNYYVLIFTDQTYSGFSMWDFRCN